MDVALLGISMSLTWLLFLLVLVFIVQFLVKDYWIRTYWKRRGVVHEPAYPIISSMPSFAKEGLWATYDALQKKHGKVYGMSTFLDPVLVVGDPDMLRHILVKNFTQFYNRPRFVNMNEDMLHGLSNLEGKRWHEVRSVVSPTFSAAKMKQMAPLVNASADNLVKHLGEMQERKGYIECKDARFLSTIVDRSEKPEMTVVDNSGLFGAFIIDTIGSCAFGLDIDSQSDPNNPFVSNAKRGFLFDFGILFFISSFFPSVGRILTRLGLCTFIPVDVANFFRDVTLKAVELRKNTPPGTHSKRVDFLQLLIDVQKDTETAEATDEDDVLTINQQQETHSHTKTLAKNVKLTEKELCAQAILFFIAGYETTTTLLGFIFYALARNPEIQDKLIDEVDKVTPSRDSVGYTSVASMPYLDQVVCETLRMFPPAVISNRICNETFEYNGLVVDKGVHIFFPIRTIHYNPEYWPEPEKFDPERFSKDGQAKQHPFAWIPFGSGPRNCVGMRFALMETKMAVARLLQKYRFETCPQTEIPPVYGMAGTLTPPNGVTLRAVPRTDAVA